MLKLTSKAVGDPKGKLLPTVAMINDLGQVTNLKLPRRLATGSWWWSMIMGGETARSDRPITRPPINTEDRWALVCELPTAIKGRAERRT